MKFLHSDKSLKMKNKKGGMLVLVLIIFAIALILVSSALTITIASRSRYYVDAETSQERLTLVCAAETIIDAIETQELSDKMLEGSINTELIIRGANTTEPGSSAAPNDGKKIAPGLTAGSGSQTKCKVTRDTESKDIFLDFSTVIDATGRDKNPENLRVRLKYTEPGPAPDICANMVTAGEDGASNDSPKLVVSDPRSFTVYHGDATVSNTSASFIHNRAIFTGKIKFGQGATFYNDVIFYGPKAGYDVNSGGNGLLVEGTHSIYFLGVAYDGQTGKQKALQNTDGSAATDGGGIQIGHGNHGDEVSAYFWNSGITVNNYTMANNYCKLWGVGKNASITITRTWGGNDIVTSDNGTASASGENKVYKSGEASVPAAVQTKFTQLENKAKTYMATGGEVDSAAKHKVPSSESLAGYAKPTSGELKGSNYSGLNSTVDGGTNYKISGTFTAGTMYIDLSMGSTTLMMNSNVTFRDFFIKVDNSYGNTLTIVMAQGVEFICKDQCDKCKDTGRTCGIISCPHVSEDWTKVEGQANTPNPCRAVAGSKPAAYIIGLGGNYFEAGRACTVDGYISLGGRAENGETPGTVKLGDNVNFYGRIEAVKFLQGNSDNLVLEYCPAPSEESDAPKPLTSKYTAEEYQFYYNSVTI